MGQDVWQNFCLECNLRARGGPSTTGRGSLWSLEIHFGRHFEIQKFGCTRRGKVPTRRTVRAMGWEVEVEE